MKLVVLDRDGVINQDRDDYVRSVQQWVPLPGSIEAMARLSRAGWGIYVATNQSGLGRGYFSEHVLRAMHERMRHLLAGHGAHVEGIVWCPHTPSQSCSCRKPLAGMLDTIQAMAGIKSLDGVPLIGDSIRDLEAASLRGMTPFLVRTGKGRISEQEIVGNPQHPFHHVPIYDDLATWVDAWLLNRD